MVDNESADVFALGGSCGDESQRVGAAGEPDEGGGREGADGASANEKMR